MLLEGLTPQPLLLSILGYSGAEFGLSVFEDISAAEAMLEERPMDAESFFFLTFHDNWQAMQMRRQLKERGLPTLPDSAPLILTPQRFGGAREYRLMTDILSLLSRYKAPGPKAQTFGSVTVTWPVSPSDLHKLKSKYEEAANTGKLGRNDPCWCGSGKKYKKCHLGKD